MVTDDLRNFFVASAGAAGALVGLLFVALSVAHEREEERVVSEAHAIRASAALTVFTNALTVSLFALVPDTGLGETTAILGALGLAFVAGSALRLVRLHRAHLRVRLRDLFFLAGGTALFALQLAAGIRLWAHPHRVADADEVADLVVASLLFGIARSWELIGGQRVNVLGEVGAILKQSPATEEESPAKDA